MGLGLPVTISATVTGYSYPINPNGVSVDVSAIAGTAPGTTILPLILSASPGVYTNTYTVAANTSLYGVQTLTVTAVDSGLETNSATYSLTVSPLDVWTGLGGDNTWANGANWISGLVPQSGDYVTFAGTTQTTPNMESAYSLGALTFATNAGSFNITNVNNTLTLTGSVTNNSPNLQALSVPVALTGVQIFAVAAGNIALSNNVSDGGSSGGITVVGTNALILTGNNSYTGTTIVSNNSTLQLDNTASGNIAMSGSSALGLSSGSKLQLRADTTMSFTPASLALQNASDTLNFDVNSLTGATGNTLTLSGALAFANSSSQTINVTGNSTYTLSLGSDHSDIPTSHTPYLQFTVNTLPTGAGVLINSITSGNWGARCEHERRGPGDGRRQLEQHVQREFNLLVNNGTTVTLQGQSVKADTGDGYKYDVVNGTLVLDNNNALINNTTRAGLNQALLLLGAATNVYQVPATRTEAGVLTATNNSYNAAVYLGDASATYSGGGLTFTPVAFGTTNFFYVSDGDVGFTNNGVFTIGGQNTSGVNTYNSQIVLGWTANRGKSVTLVAATGGTVNFVGSILANGTDTSAGVTVGDSVHGGIVVLSGTNTYAGGTTLSNGVLLVNGIVTNGVKVFNGTTNGGSGVVFGGVTVSGGGHTLPSGYLGNPALGLTNTVIGSLTYNTGAEADFNLGGTYNGGNDQIIVSNGHCECQRRQCWRQLDRWQS